MGPIGPFAIETIVLRILGKPLFPFWHWDNPEQRKLRSLRCVIPFHGPPLLKVQTRVRSCNLAALFTGWFIWSWNGFGFNFVRSTVCQILPGLMGIWQKLAGQMGKKMEHPNQSLPNPDPRPDKSPCTLGFTTRASLTHRKEKDAWP